MSDSTKVEPAESTKPQPPRPYGFSAILTGFGRLFRSFLSLVLVIVANALVQAVLVAAFDPQPALNPLFFVLLLISVAFFVWSFYSFNLIALEGSTGKPRFANIFRRTAREWGWFILWAFIMYVLVLAGLVVSTYLAIAIIILLPFVTLAASDGNRNPLKTNFRVMGRRIWRYLVTAVIFLPLLGISLLFTSVNGFFIGGGIGSFITWLYWGVVGAWYLNTLGLIYRSTDAGMVTEDSVAVPSESR